ncbi:agouti-signaling protein-like isoform X2 [Pempheris klunzingeri]|uniref:agouti-signaling protein-like isoform X2 n=1 Tax=Pempheris klunzingeri TaxID=3127111 RepID=UPI0039807438
MTLAISWFCILQLAFVSAGLFTRNDLQALRSNVSASRAQAPQSAGSSNHRKRPIFARRGQYEQQRIHVPKSKVIPVPPSKLPPPSEAVTTPVKSKCSQFTQTCYPQSGCCNPCATCHCRFFNAICFCRRTVPACKTKT